MSAMHDPSEALAAVCKPLMAGELENAKAIIRSKIPFEAIKAEPRKYSKKQLMALWKRDRFRDRYTNKRLVFPGTLRLLSALMPNEFPYHSAWKYEKCHALYWELYPTLDHIYPVSRGGLDEEANWVTTSMMRNSIKGSFTLGEVGWQIHEIEDINWDGLISFYQDYLSANPEILSERGVKEWYSTSKH